MVHSLTDTNAYNLCLLRHRHSHVLPRARPTPFHAEHQGDHATFSFDGALVGGSLRSPTARRRVEQWATMHRRELQANWASMKAGHPLERIEPLQ